MFNISEELRTAMAAVELTNPHLSEQDKAGAAFTMVAFRAGHYYAQADDLTRQQAESEFFGNVQKMTTQSLRMFNQ